MREVVESDQVSAGYEALRAQAVGGLPTHSPRGLALLLSQGIPAWIAAGVSSTSTATTVGPSSGARTMAPGLAGDVVRLLTEMALGHRTRLAQP